MNEIAKNYYETVNERSITAKSSHAKNGQNSEKLGNRQLTLKEIEEQHGPVKTYTFDDFLSFSEFREMPTDWQAGYINHLQDKYDVGLTQIGRNLFGQRDDNVLRSHLKLNGILNKVNPDKRRGRTRLHEFRRDIREYRTAPKKEKPVEKPAMNFMGYADFKALVPANQVTFINRIISEYGVGIKNIGEDLFGMKNGNVLTNYIKRKVPGYTPKRNTGDTRSAAYKAKFERFQRDIQLWRLDTTVVFDDFAAKQIANAVEVPVSVLENNKAQSLDSAFQKFADAAKSGIDAKLDESVKSLNDRVEKGEIVTANDVAKEIGLTTVPEENNVVIAKPPVFKTKQKVFSTCYIGDDFNMAEIEALRKMFAGQKIQVEITVTTDNFLEKYE